MPDLMWPPTTRLTLDEQLMEREHALSHQGIGHCVVTLPHAVSFDACVHNVQSSVVSDARLQEAHDRYHQSRAEQYMPKADVFDAINMDPTQESSAEEDDLTFRPSTGLS